MKELIRELRDQAFSLATAHRQTVEIEGVMLTLKGASPRMRYVMSKGYETEDAKLASQVLTPNDKVLEAGSAIGFLAAYCQKIIGVTDYCLVEANVGLKDAINENFRLNGLGEPKVITAAVSDEDGEVSFGVHRNFWSSSTVERRGAKRTTVPARSIPSIIEELPFKPNVLIMDIEGGEAIIPPAHLEPFDKLVIEFHPKLVGEGKIRGLTDAIEAMGFKEIARMGGSRAYKR